MTARGVCYVAGLPVTPAGLDDAAALICEDARERLGRVYVLLNGHSAKLRRSDRSYAQLLADPVRVVGLADGASVSAAARLLGHGDIGRAPGPDLIEACCSRCAEQGIPVFLLGGAEGVAATLAESLEARHPGLHVAGTATPPFGEWPAEASEAMVAAVVESGAGVVWLGVSAPKQEVWAHRNIDRIGVPVVCVGAAFDFNTGAKPRAPEWMRRAGIEWVYRLITEPRRLWKRYLVGNTLFVADVVRYRRRAAGIERQAV